MSEPKQLNLLSDDPIENAATDSLDRAFFAGRIVQILDSIRAETRSSVLGLIGPWGSGKSSLLSLVGEQLRKNREWQVVPFNPWEPTDLDAILRSFFLAIIALFPEEGQWRKRRTALATYADGLRPWAEIAKIPLIDPGKAFGAVGNYLKGDQSLPAKRKEVVDALVKYGKPILVTVDDVDRLHPEELMLLFKLVRLIGNLPNVYYLLAYDEETLLDVVTSTDLARDNQSRALAYLEKIVQIRLDLPPVHEQQGLSLINRALDSIVSRHKVRIEPDGLARFGSAYQRFIKVELVQPRSIKRYFGQVEAYLPLVIGEVNFVDFLLVTYLRTVHPKVYAMLREHRADLVKTWQLTVTRESTPAEARTTWEERLQGLGVANTNGMLQLLRELFLPIRGAVDNVAGYSPDYYADLDRQQRIGSANYFDRYFQFGVAPWDIQDVLVDAAAAELEAGTPGDSLLELRQLASTRGDLLLDKLIRIQPELTDRSKLELLIFLGSVYSSLPTEGGGIIVLPPRLRAPMIAGDLLSSLSGIEQDRQRTFLERLKSFDRGVEFAAKALDNALRDLAEDSKEIPPWLEDLKRSIAGGLSEVLDEMRRQPLDSDSGVIGLLFQWARFADVPTVQAWLMQRVVEKPWSLEDFLALLVPIGTAYVEGGGKPILGTFPVAELTELLPLDWIAARLQIEAKDTSGRLNEMDVSMNNRKRAAKRAIKMASDRASSGQP